MRDINYTEVHNNCADLYGEPYIFDDKENIKQINEQYFAAFFIAIYLLKYSPSESSFNLYNPARGAWEKITKHKLLDLVGLFIKKYADHFHVQEILHRKTRTTISAIIEFIKGQAEQKHSFDLKNRKELFVHCQNVMVVFDPESRTWIPKEFAPEYHSRNVSPITFLEGATCPSFLEKLLLPAMTLNDIDLLQLYVGQCLLGINLSQTFLLLTGTAGGGKGTLLNVIEGVIGPWNCTELRLEHAGTRFEIGRYLGKRVLTAKDVASDFLSLNGAKKIKLLTGNDRVSTEYKNRNDFTEIQGTFNILIAANGTLRIEFDEDIEAWRRRLLWIKFENPPTPNKIVNFDKILLNEEGSGILNWALEGAAKLLRNGGIIKKTPEQESRIDTLLKYSNPFALFAEKFIHPTPGASLITEEAVAKFQEFCKKIECQILPERKVQLLFHEFMRSKYGATLRTDINFHGKNRRGYVNFQIRNKV